MENLRNLFSEGSGIPEDLKETVEKIYSIVERLNKRRRDEQQFVLWRELENILGIEVEIITQEYELEERVIRDNETSIINRRKGNIFDVLFQSLPSLYTCCDSHCGTEYIILPNNFVIFLDESGLDFSENLEKIADRILDEAKRHEEYNKLCEEEEKRLWSEYPEDED